mmetsp:Transcript_17193/g.56970  ORF Transcript_17193/g.56970 Transcript_17193/m.56970 type:complete len:80 (+) Transcript_17193:2410-2649(+)
MIFRPTRSISSITNGNGKLSFRIKLLTNLISVQKRNVPSDFFVKITGDVNSDVEGSMIPRSNKKARFAFNSSSNASGTG